MRGHYSQPGGVAEHWSLALYYARIHNEILSVEDPSQPGTMLSTNYAATIHAGIEGLWRARFPVAHGAYRLEPLVSASWNDFSFDNDGTFGDNTLPSAPAYAVHSEVMIHNGATGLYAGPTFDWVGRRYVDMANTYRVGGHFLVGLRAGVQREQWTLFAEVRNITDQRYVNAVSVLTRAAPNARVLDAGSPRSVFIGLRMHY